MASSLPPLGLLRRRNRAASISARLSPRSAVYCWRAEPPRAAYIAQIAATLGAGSFVAIVWRRGLALPIRAAVLTAATLVAIPVALMYDLMLAGVAAAWLVRDPDGLTGRDKVILAALFLLAMIPPGLAEASHLPSGPMVALSLLGLTAVRALPRRSIRRAATA